MKRKFTLKFWKDDMGSFTQSGISSNSSETVHENALWYVNKAREHDGLRPLRRLSDGKFDLIEENS